MQLPETRYEPRQFDELVRLESEEIELKTHVPGGKGLQETLVAFSNTRGGVLYVGVTDERTVVGHPLDQGTSDRIHQAAAEAHDLGRYELREVAVGGRRVTAVVVQARSSGFAQTSDGRVLVRRGGRNTALLGDDLHRLLSARSLRRFEQEPSDLSLPDAEPAALEEIRKAFHWSDGDDLDRLAERGLADRTGRLTIAGALVLTDPGRSLAVDKFVVDLRIYDTDDGSGYRRREVLAGPVQDQVRQAATLVSRDVGNDFVVTTLRRYELPRLPPRVVREAIANAVAHRSYQLQGTAVIVEVRPSRVTVTSPGGFPEPVTKETLRQAQSARNPTLIGVLRRLDLAEDAGRGVDVMQDEMQDAILGPPQFDEVADTVVVILPIRGPVSPEERAWLVELEDTGALHPEDRLLLVHALRGVTLTNASARAVTGLDSALARRALQRLRDLGLLEMQGARGSARYTAADLSLLLRSHLLPPARLAELVVEAAQVRPLANADVRALTGLDRPQSLALLGRLVQEGRLRRIGARRGTRYEAVERSRP